VNFRDYLQEELATDPEFRREWEESEPAAQIIRALVAARSRRRWTQAELARRMSTTQAHVSRAETTGKVTPEFLARFAAAVGGQARLAIKLPGSRSFSVSLETLSPSAGSRRPKRTRAADQAENEPVVTV
jgi:transcriptional regulator with XRE-family HTH domain